MDPSGGLAIHVIIGLIATAILIIVMILYFFLWNTPNSSTITLKNNGTSTVNVLLSSPRNDGSNIPEIPVKRINGGSSFSFTAYPGTTLIISGYTDGNQNPLTNATLILGNSGVASSGKIIFDGVTYSDLTSSSEVSDQYGVSLQKGYNIPITIYPNNKNLPSGTDIFTCSGPIWYQQISDTNSVFPCPNSLESSSNCINPCQKLGENYCNCENEWPQLDYYYTFASACPNCLITTCDKLNYSCSSSTLAGLNNHSPVNYDVVFFPQLGDI